MPFVVQTRGDEVEARHPWSAVAVDAASGQVVWQTGEAVTTHWRSAAKPFQLEVSLSHLAPDLVAGLSEQYLAVGAASHSGEAVHVLRVERLLGLFGLSPEALRCGAHPPIHTASAEGVLRAGGVFGGVHNNCSGKHTFMLGACRAQGWPLEYRPAEHPLQVGNRAHLEALCGGPGVSATDGCGVPTLCFPLEGLARAWAALAAAMVDPSVAPLRSRVGWAMARHPELTSGTGRFDLAVMRAANEPMAVKIGAMGVFCVALPSRGLGLAVKVHSGVGEALSVALPEALNACAPGALAVPDGWEPALLRNVIGDVVGGYRPA